MSRRYASEPDLAERAAQQEQRGSSDVPTDDRSTQPVATIRRSGMPTFRIALGDLLSDERGSAFVDRQPADRTVDGLSANAQEIRRLVDAVLFAHG
jgi:hypothetical protein